MLRAVSSPAPTGPERTSLAGRTQDLGGLVVRRLLPTAGRRTLGPWCFADHFGPVSPARLDVEPHPHVGLATVTWLFAGALEHRDSLGSVQPIHPGQLNLMTAGRGIAHAERALPEAGPLHGVQLWLALPEATRHDPPSFLHLAELPEWRAEGARAVVFAGSLGGVTSPAPSPWPLVGAEVGVSGAAELPLDPAFEHGWVTVSGEVEVDGLAASIGDLVWLGTSRVGLQVGGRGVGVLLGGRPFPEPLLMWWNWVARTDAEIRAAWDLWASGATEPVPGNPSRAPAPPLPRG